MSFDISGISPQNPQRISPPQSTSPGKSTPTQSILNALNIRGPVKLDRLPGIQLPEPIFNSLLSIQEIKPNAMQTAALKGLGLNNVILTLVAAEESKKRKLKIRLNEVADSVFDHTTKETLESIFGTPFNEIEIDDNGSLIVLNGTKEIENSITKE